MSRILVRIIDGKYPPYKLQFRPGNRTHVSRIPRPCGRDYKRWCVAMLGVLFLLLVVRYARAAPEPLQPQEGLIIAPDISLSMRKKLPAVQHAALTLIDGLDVQRQYRVALVRFGTTANQVIDVTLDSEVARGILRSAVEQLQTTDQWTHFDELVNFLALKVPTFSTARVSALVYSGIRLTRDS